MSHIEQKLFEMAKAVRKNAFAPISKFQVGAAVYTKNGNFYAGCNVESATMTQTTHAEMNAIDTAVAAGDKEITKILIITHSKSPAFPCALCRQKIAEFSRNATVIATTSSGKSKTSTIKKLYPEPFLLKNISK